MDPGDALSYTRTQRQIRISVLTLADLGFFRGGGLWEPERASIEGVRVYGRMKFERL